MDKPSSSDRPEKKQRGGELVIPVLALAFTVYYFYSILDAPWTAKVSTYFIGSILIALVAVYIGLTLRAVFRDEAGLGLAGLVAPVSFLPKRVALLLLTVGYIVGLQWGGFTLTTFGFLYLAMLVLGSIRVHRTALILAIAYALGGYLLFVAMFGTRFPEGPFEQLMKVVF